MHATLKNNLVLKLWDWKFGFFPSILCPSYRELCRQPDTITDNPVHLGLIKEKFAKADYSITLKSSYLIYLKQQKKTVHGANIFFYVLFYNVESIDYLKWLLRLQIALYRWKKIMFQFQAFLMNS